MQLTIDNPTEVCNGCRKGEYRTCKELNYYGSDLNKYADKECTREMTVNNIDLIQFKRTQRTVRITESKHSNEKMDGTQREVLNKLAWGFNLLNKIQDQYIFEVFIVVADPPYNKAYVENLITKEKRYLYEKAFKDFMEFKEVFAVGDI